MYIVLQNTSRSGMEWQINDDSPLVIGRSEGCDIRVYDEFLSRRHLEVWLEAGKVRFKDLGSSNATLVNGSPVRSGTLSLGDSFALGSTVFRIEKEPRQKPLYDSGTKESTPITLSVRLGSYSRGQNETRLNTAPLHRTVQELHDLFQLGRELGAVESVAELTTLLETNLRKRFEPCALWVAWRYAADQPLLFQALEGTPEGETPPAELLRQALETREGLIRPSVHRSQGGRHPQTLMAVPLVHADHPLGGFVVCGRAPGRTYVEEDLHFALGIAEIVAPHVRAVRQAEQLRRDNEALQARTGGAVRLLGKSPLIAHVRDLLERAAESSLAVLLLGETGTGKEIAARMVHEASPRRDGPYVVVNCAAVPGDLFESEFFGHERGAFTGATQQRAGRFEEANGGTLFLDEIGDLSPDNQARILRTIETSTYRRVGGEKLKQVDVRIIAATNKTLAEPNFRLDLLHRLNTVTVQMPPLRSRPEDIPQLADHFLRLSSSHGAFRVTDIDPDAITLLQCQPWPGNVRELKALIDRAIVFAKSTKLSPRDLQLSSSPVNNMNNSGAHNNNNANNQPLLALAEIERRHILHVLQACQGNISAAARTLGINRVTLYKRIAEYQE